MMSEPELVGAVAETLGSVQQLATELAINRRLVLRWMNGAREVHPAEWRDIAAVLKRRLSTTREHFPETAAGRRAQWVYERMTALLGQAEHYSTKPPPEKREPVELPEHLQDWNRE